MTYTRPTHNSPASDGSVTDLTVVLDALSAGLEAVEARLPSGSVVVPSTGVAATDTAAIMAAHDAFSSSGGTIYLDNGPYLFTAGSVAFTKPIHLIGQGPGGANVAYGGSYLTVGSVINCTSSTGHAITVDADGCTFEKLAIFNTSVTTPSAGSAIAVLTYGKGTRIVDCAFSNFYINVDIRNGYEWFVRDCQFFDPVYAGLKTDSLLNGDAGDPSIVGCMFIAGPTNLTPTAGLRWEGSGAPKVVGCKFNGRGSAKFTAGADFQVRDGTLTDGPYIGSCSLENSTYGIRIGNLGPANTGRINKTTITGCETAIIGQYAIYVAPHSSAQTQSLSITGCTLGASVGAVYLSYTNVVTMTGNCCDATPLTRGSAVTNVTADGSMASQVTLNGATAGTAKSSHPIISPLYKKEVIVLAGYQNSGGAGTQQSIYHTDFTAAPKITVDTGTSGATVDASAVRLPYSMGSPVSGFIIVEGY